MTNISRFKASDHALTIFNKPEKVSEGKGKGSSFVSLGLKALAAGAVWAGYTASQSAPNFPAAEFLRLGGCAAAGAALLADRILYPQSGFKSKLSFATITALFGCVLLQGAASYHEFNDALETVKKNREVTPVELTGTQSSEKFSPIAAMFFLKIHEDISLYIGPDSEEIRPAFNNTFKKIEKNQPHTILLPSYRLTHKTHFDIDVCATENEIKNGLTADTQGTGMWFLNTIPANPTRTQCYISEPACSDSSVNGGIRIHFVNCSNITKEKLQEYQKIEDAVASIKNNRIAIEHASDTLLKTAGYNPSNYIQTKFPGCTQYDSVLTRFLSEDNSQKT